MTRKAALFIDFDGTICPVDISNTFFTRYASDDAQIAVQQWKQGLISSVECLRRELEAYKGKLSLLQEFARQQPIDEGFYRLRSICDEKGIDIFIVSDGLDYYINAFLERHGVSGTVYTNTLTANGESWQLLFPFYNEECGRCANCKSSHVERERSKGKFIVYVGDGLSDKCAARRADIIFAKGDLARYCDENQIRYHSFSTLDEVADYISSPEFAEILETA